MIFKEADRLTKVPWQLVNRELCSSCLLEEKLFMVKFTGKAVRLLSKSIQYVLVCNVLFHEVTYLPEPKQERDTVSVKHFWNIIYGPFRMKC